MSTSDLGAGSLREDRPEHADCSHSGVVYVQFDSAPRRDSKTVFSILGAAGGGEGGWFGMEWKVGGNESSTHAKASEVNGGSMAPQLH